MILYIILYDIIRYHIILHMIYLRKRLGASGKTMVGEKQWLASLCRSMLPADTTPATNAPARCAHHLNLNHRSGARSKLNGRTIQHIRSTVPYSQGCRYSTRNDADIPRLKNKCFKHSCAKAPARTPARERVPVRIRLQPVWVFRG